MNRLNPQTILAAIVDPASPLFESKRLARARHGRLEELSRQLECHAGTAAAKGVKVRTLVAWEKRVHEGIVRAATLEGADLIVARPLVSEPAHAHFRQRQTGRSLARLCPQPLLLVRSGSRSHGPVLAELDLESLRDRPATLDQAIIHIGAGMAQKPDTPFHVSIKKSEQAATAMREALHRAGVEAEEIAVMRGLPETNLPALATKLRTQTLVVGGVRRRERPRYVLDRTAEVILDTAPCDLLRVKPDGFEPKLRRARTPLMLLRQEREVIAPTEYVDRSVTSTHTA